MFARDGVDGRCMCGILGVIPTRRSEPLATLCDTVAMRDTMESRGPDDYGLLTRNGVVLAHRRLSIRDLAHGKQPWTSPDGRYAIVYNGEIYNDDELRRQLRSYGHRFRTECDTEVLMAAWQVWGQACVQRLRGMFAFGVYDFHRDEVFLVRDRCGVKPLFYANINGDFVFASTIKAILRHPGLSPKPNLSAIRHYLATLRLTLDRETVFDGIYTVRPAEILRLSDGHQSHSAYWHLPSNANYDCSFSEAVGEFETELRRSVSMRMKSDVPVGMMMSGGVDSNTLAVLVDDASSSKRLGVCGGGAGRDEPQQATDFHFARDCANTLGFEFDDVRLGESDYRETWKHLVDEYATPISTPTDVIINHVARRLKRDVGVALGGEGADELLCGYSVSHWSGTDFDLSRQINSFEPDVAVRIQQSLQQQYGSSSFASPGDHYLAANSLIPAFAQKQLFRPEHWAQASNDSRMERFYNGFYECGHDQTTAERTAALLHRVNLESLLSRLDSATMQAGLEARVPYTDHVLVELGFRLPHAYRIDVDPSEKAPWLSSMELESRGSLRSKRVLRKIAGGMMPDHLAYRPKASFPTPLASWLANEWNNEVREELTNSSFAREIFDEGALAQIAALPPQLSLWKWPVLNLVRWGERQFV